MADKRIKDLKIKTGVCKRLTKEKLYYEKEEQREKERYDKMKSDGKDEYELRKQGEVIQESKLMIPDTLRKLEKAREELNNLLDTEKDLSEAVEYKDAKKIVEEADKVIDDGKTNQETA